MSEIAAVDPQNAVVHHISAATVTAAFGRGAVLVDEPRLAIHASRREHPGPVEVHAHETDTFYIMAGTAVLVTGGAVVAPESPDPGEIRGSSIEGGEARRLAPGDVVVVPNGVPHWFKEVDGPLVYYTVKVRRG